MFKLKERQEKILEIFLSNKTLSSSEVLNEFEKLGEKTSIATIKRNIAEMLKSGFLKSFGGGRSANYSISILGRIFSNVDSEKYISIDPDKRFGLKSFNFELFENFPTKIFSDEEMEILENLTDRFRKKTENLPETINKKELERLIIELSWKSSKIEGNTYTLLDTEKLILENQVAKNKTKYETQMILNHKDAFLFIRENSKNFQNLTKKNLQELHSILIKNLDVSTGFRSHPIGITGSIYKPLDNFYQISEAVESLEKKISEVKNPFAKSLLSFIGISYIQPFEDGNKRTSRLMANAILMSHNLAPISYRSIDEKTYRDAILVFYELNSIIPAKKIFIEQYEFGAKNYTTKN